MMPPPMIPGYSAGGFVPGMAAAPVFFPPPPVSAGIPAQQQVPMNPDTTGYFGNLSPGVAEDVVTAILVACGGFKRMKRPVDPSSGKPKSFALVEFESADDLFRAFGLLQDFLLDNRHLSIKIENPNLKNFLKLDVNEELKCYEAINRVLIGKKMTSGGSMEWLDKKIFQLKSTVAAAVEDKNVPVRRDSRQRNYSDLIEEEFSKTTSSTANKTDSHLALRDRERRWEGRVKEFEKDLRRDMEKDEERSRRHLKEAAQLAEYIETYVDVEEFNFGALHHRIMESGKVVFFSDREKWRKMRERAMEREAEIFSDCQQIKNEIFIQKQREFIERNLPVEKEEIFAYPVRWDKFEDCVSIFKEICRERTAAFFKTNRELSLKLGEIIFDQIAEKRQVSWQEICLEPTFLAVSSDSEEAEVLYAILWRWLIFYTSVGRI